MKKIWILGADGMLGSHFLRTLQKRNIPHVATFAHSVDVRELEQVMDFASSHDLGAIINCAAYTAVDKAEDEKNLAFDVNALGTENVAKAAAKNHLQLLHFSTDYIFDGTATTPYHEESEPKPVSSYGNSKWEGEKRLFEQKKDALLLRISWLYGFPGKNFVETMLRLMNEKDELKIVNDQKGSPTYCQDVVDVSLELLEKGHQGIFHFANSGVTSWHGFAAAIKQLAEKHGISLRTKNILPITTEEYPTKAKRPAYSVLNTLKIETTLGRTPRSWQEALEEYLISYHPKENPCPVL